MKYFQHKDQIKRNITFGGSNNLFRKIMHKIKYPIWLILLLALFSCSSVPDKRHEGKPVTIAVSKMHPKHTYCRWLHHHDSTLLLVNMYPLGVDSALKVAAGADGILITGGEDVYPGYYGKAYDTVRCGTINHYRDSLELALIHYAVEHNIPLIGVCRGEQIINVAMGGSLIIDIPSDVGTKVKHASKDWKLQWHHVNIIPHTLMHDITGVEEGTVSSSHHQAIERLGTGLMISAYADDSIPEAVEWNIKGKKGFLMATQWHPEHMNYNDPLSAAYAETYLKEARNYHHSKTKH
jgi:putative glutamine amidotransferase